MSWEIRRGDVMDRLREMPDDSVHCVVTSPPYWSLRDYGVSGQIGLEPTIGEWVSRMVEVFLEVRRVLHPTGTLWLNLGDSYAGSWGSNGRGPGSAPPSKIASMLVRAAGGVTGAKTVDGLKNKDLIGQPWRVAFALQDAGWWLRSEIIWHKPQCLPESVQDRPVKAHETVFLLTKSRRYFFDSEAIREPVTGRANARRRDGQASPKERCNAAHRDPAKGMAGAIDCSTRSPRTVWTIGTRPFPGAHFATFPPELPDRCIRAGTSQHGACPECGSQWRRIVEKGGPNTEHQAACGGTNGYRGTATKNYDGARAQDPSATKARILAGMRERKTVGWAPTCDCRTADVVRPIVLDPFSGAGTTVMVARRLNCRGIGIELNPDYAAMSEERIRQDAPLFNSGVTNV